MLTVCLTAYMQVLSMIAMLAVGGLYLFSTPGQASATSFLIPALGLSSLGTWLVCTGVAALTVKLEKRTIIPYWKGILGYWIYILSWLPINIICLFKRDTDWSPIEHSRTMRLQDLAIKGGVSEEE